MVLAITGGGSRAIAELLEQPGGSRTLLEAVVPYSAAAMSDWLGAQPEHFCEPATARAMAMAAFRRAERLAGLSAEKRVPAGDLPSDAFAGIGCTASLASDRPKRGAHRIHVAAQTSRLTLTQSLELVKGARQRAEEEQLAARLTLNMLAEALGLADRLPLDLLPAEQCVSLRTEAAPAWRELLLGQAAAVRQLAGSTVALPASVDSAGRALFPGAFNPLHAGHRQIVGTAAERLGMPVEFEISIENVDKPPLDFTEIQRRGEQFGPNETLLADPR